MIAATSHLHGDAPTVSTPQAESDRRALAFVAMERTRMPMVVTDARLPDNPIVLANRAFLRETGYAADEVIGRNCRFLQGAETDPAVIARMREDLRAEREMTVELVNYRKDGSRFWNELYISPIHDDDGKLLYFFASQLDVSSRHDAEALETSEHLLLREVDHRAKNALAMVQGIVRLTKRNDAEAFAEAVQGRVDALARAHAILADEHWRGVGLDRVIRGEIGFHAARIQLCGDRVELDPAQVQPVALLLHELAANARHHGALSVPAGRVTIEWQRDACTRELRIRWTERGGPAPAGERVRGYGQTMIEAIANRQLGGHVDLAWHEAGLVADMVIPLRVTA